MPFCMLFAGLGSTNKSAIFLPFSYLILALSSLSCLFLHLSFYLNLWQELSSLSCSIRLQWIPEHSFLPGNDAADKLARRGALLAPSAIPCSVSPLTSRIHSCLFSDWRCTASSKFVDTGSPDFHRGTCAPSSCSLCSLSSSLQRTQLTVKFLSL